VANDLVEQVVHISARVVVRVLADEHDPRCALIRMERDDGAPGAAQMANAEPVQVLAGHSLLQSRAAPLSEIRYEPLEGFEVRTS
jgi:hypothetical protein